MRDLHVAIGVAGDRDQAVDPQQLTWPGIQGTQQQSGRWSTTPGPADWIRLLRMAGNRPPDYLIGPRRSGPAGRPPAEASPGTGP